MSALRWLVAGWPDLEVDGYDEVVDSVDFVPDTEKLQMLRMDRLSANVLICLFEGEVKTVDIHQKPEALHFGLDPNDSNTGFNKILRNSEGVEQEDIKIQNIPWTDEAAKVINIAQLASEIKTTHGITFTSFTSAQFALEMIEGVEKVRFALGS